MELDLRQLILFMHILVGIIWFGGVLFVGWGVFPAVQNLKPTTQREVLSELMLWVHWPLTLAGIGVIISGFVLGTVGGPLKNWEAVISTSYGHLFATALIAGIFTLLWGTFVGYKHTMAVFSRKEIWRNAEKGDNKALKKALFGIAAIETVEIAGFVTMLTCMVLI